MSYIKNKTYTAFTLIETVTTLMLSGIIFLGLFYVFTVLNDKFEKEFITGELSDYCNYALDDISKSIRVANNIRFDSHVISTLDENDNVIDNYYLDQISGIMKNGNPVHLNNSLVIYNPTEKNGYIRYELVTFDISEMSQTPEYIQNTIYSEASAFVTTNTIVIKLYTKLIMGTESDIPEDHIAFKRVVFSPGMYFKSIS